MKSGPLRLVFRNGFSVGMKQARMIPAQGMHWHLEYKERTMFGTHRGAFAASDGFCVKAVKRTKSVLPEELFFECLGFLVVESKALSRSQPFCRVR